MNANVASAQEMTLGPTAALERWRVECYCSTTMQQPTTCPSCQSENIYNDGALWVCPECAHEWTGFEAASAPADDAPPPAGFRDAFGTALVDGDAVTVVKELKIKGSSAVVKAGTKVRNIRLRDQGDGHDIACKIDGVGAINLKSEFVRKA